MGVRATNFTLDDYIFFLENGIHRDLSIRHLNQIISMHGFKKLHKLPKKNVADALSCINLLFPFRSTLMENISSSSASLAKDEVATDLATLSWQECTLQSIETLTSMKHTINHDCGIEEYGDLILGPNSENNTVVDGLVKRRRTFNAVGLEQQQLLLPCWLSM